MALEDALSITNGYAVADTDRNGLTYDELTNYLNNYPHYQNGFRGYIKDGWSDELVDMEWGVAGYASDDFVLDFGAPVPEPGTIVAIAMGMVGMAGVLRRRMR
jgi:hypothetical protein